MPDHYTTTPNPLRPMICSACGGHFAGSDHNVIKQVTPIVILCDPCKKERKEIVL